VGLAANQSSPVPKSLLNASMKEKYQNFTLLSYNDPSSMPIRQPYQVPGAKSSFAYVICFFEYGAKSSSAFLSMRIIPCPEALFLNQVFLLQLVWLMNLFQQAEQLVHAVLQMQMVGRLLALSNQ
jgi:hypothetical protein